MKACVSVEKQGQVDNPRKGNEWISTSLCKSGVMVAAGNRDVSGAAHSQTVCLNIDSLTCCIQNTTAWTGWRMNNWSSPAPLLNVGRTTDTGCALKMGHRCLRERSWAGSSHFGCEALLECKNRLCVVSIFLLIFVCSDRKWKPRQSRIRVYRQWIMRLL